MVVSQNRIIQSLTGKANLEEVSLQELENIVNLYPSLPAGHLLLTKKLLQLKQEETALSQKQKTAIYFSDIFWLDSLLNDFPDYVSRKNIEEPAALFEEKQTSVEEEISLTKVDDEEAIPAVDVKEAVDEGLLNQEPTIEATITEAAVEVPEEQLSTEEEAELLPVDNVKEPVDADLRSKELTTDDTIPGAAVETIEAHTPVEEEFNVDRKEFAEHLLADTDNQEDEESLPEEKEADTDFNPALSKILSEQAQEFSKPVEEDAKLPIESEPYYTIDYFDSQGIRLDPAQLGKDRLGRKVRKFTDWLKDMKRVGGQPTDLGTDPEMEKAIQTIAAASNETKEIVTEAMAEILIKEGKTAKAVKLYEKLSFLNPDKSAYFAAKIEHIKGLS